MASNRMPLAMLALLVALAPAISGLRADNFTITVKNLDGTNVPPPLPGVPDVAVKVFKMNNPQLPQLNTRPASVRFDIGTAEIPVTNLKLERKPEAAEPQDRVLTLSFDIDAGNPQLKADKAILLEFSRGGSVTAAIPYIAGVGAKHALTVVVPEPSQMNAPYIAEQPPCEPCYPIDSGRCRLFRRWRDR